MVLTAPPHFQQPQVTLDRYGLNSIYMYCSIVIIYIHCYSMVKDVCIYLQLLLILYKYVHLTLNKVVINWTSTSLLQYQLSTSRAGRSILHGVISGMIRTNAPHRKRIGTLLKDPQDDPNLPFIGLPMEIKENVVHTLFSNRE